MGWQGYKVLDPTFIRPLLLLLGITSLLLLLARSWKLMVLVLAFQYLGAFVLVLLSWPVNMALVMLVAGWMACLILAAILWNTPDMLIDERFAPSGRLFRLLAAGLVLIIIQTGAVGLQDWLPEVDFTIIWASLLLIGMGLLHLGLTAHPFRSIVGLLTVYLGFEILYASLENSALVAGLLAGLTVGFALVGAYLTAAPDLEEELE